MYLNVYTKSNYQYDNQSYFQIVLLQGDTFFLNNHLDLDLNLVLNFQLVLSVDKEAKDKLLMVKDKLNEDVEVNDNNFINKLTKIIELKDNLKNSIL